MAQTTASGRMALGSIMGAISTTANTVSGTLDAVNQGVGMLNHIITTAAKQQKDRSILDADDFQEYMVRDKAMQNVLSLKAVKEFIDADEFNKLNYEESYQRYSALLGRHKETSGE